MAVNKVILVGNVGADPTINTLPDGRGVASFNLATTEYWKDKTSGEKKERTEWHRVAIFAQGLVNITREYVKKGSKLYLEGSLQTRKWTDKQGVEKYTTEVVLQTYNSKLELLTPKGNAPAHPQEAPAAHKPETSPPPFVPPTEEEAMADDIPF